jgi:hypothetical protein
MQQGSDAARTAPLQGDEEQHGGAAEQKDCRTGVASLPRPWYFNSITGM